MNRSGTVSVVIDAAAPVFAGHFPQQPILPGVLLIAFARQAISKSLGRPATLRRIVRQRFMQPVLPGSVISVECEAGTVDSDGQRFTCRWRLLDGSLAARAELVVARP